MNIKMVTGLNLNQGSVQWQNCMCVASFKISIAVWLRIPVLWDVVLNQWAGGSVYV
jgi:hypothetical protein